MMSISTEASEARASLKDDRELVRTFEVKTSGAVIQLMYFGAQCARHVLCLSSGDPIRKVAILHN